MDSSFEQDRSELPALAQGLSTRLRWRVLSWSVSLALHALVVVLLCWPRTPIFVKPTLLAHGEGGSAAPESLVLYVPSDLQLAEVLKPPLLALPAASHKKQQKAKLWKRTNLVEAEDKPDSSAEVGSEQGTGYDGSASGDEVKPALPVAFQDLKIPRSDLPGGVQGDVIVEITIDAQGTVVEERLLQGLAPGVDERVIAVLHDWRFRPATRNGVAISSKHDVHFHFPS